MIQLPPISFTFHKNFENCPHKAFHLNIAKDIPFKETAATQWGTTVHAAFEKRINRGTPLPVGMEKWEPFCAFPPFSKVKAELKLGMRADGSACDFFADDVWNRGVIDVLVIGAPLQQVAAIIDHKTGKVREDSDELEHHAVLLKANNPRLERITGWYNWLAEDRAGKFHDLSNTEAKLASIRETRATIERLAPLGGEAFPKQQNPLCNYCPVKTCEFNGRFSR